MKSKIKKLLVTGLVLASFSLMGCEPDKDAEGPVSITVKDADGNEYPTVKIGQQIWMAKNLNVNVPGSMCYENKPENCEKYERLYTWEAARNACPSGWHLPSKEEMESFVEAVKVRIEQIVTQKKLDAVPLREGEGELHNHLRDASWREGFDSFGFSALPAGYYDGDFKKFSDLGYDNLFWSSTEFGSRSAGRLHIYGNKANVYGVDKDDGYSVRCLQD